MSIYLEFKWTVSRGRDTYGYNICTLYADGTRVARCNGGGYDMQGTNLGNYIASHYAERLLALDPNKMPPNSHWEPERARECAGACWEKWNEALMGRLSDAVKEPGELPLLPKLPEDCWECPTCKGKTRASRDGKTIDDGRYFYGLRFVDPKYNPLDAILERCDDTFTKPEDVGKTFRQLQKEGKIVDLDVIRAWYSSTSPHPSKRHCVPTIDGACGMSSVQKIANAIGLTFEHVPVRSKNLTIYKMNDEHKAAHV